jgi:cell division inhibitor SepF
VARLFEKMKDLMFGEYDEDEEDFAEEYEEQPARESSYGLREVSRERDVTDFAPTPLKKSRTNPQVYSINTSVQMQVVIIKPECYEDAQEICDQVKTKKPVVVNLEKVEFPIAQRIMDFLSGTCYSLDGSIQRVANNIFIIAPENVDISGDFKEELKTKGVILPWVSSGR